MADQTQQISGPQLIKPHPAYPKLLFNVNVWPIVVNNADEERALGADWQEFDLSQAIIHSAQAKP